MNNTAMNIHVQVFIGTYTFAFLALLFFPPSCEALIFTGKPCGFLETLPPQPRDRARDPG